jgi:hypothetical protein
MQIAVGAAHTAPDNIVPDKGETEQQQSPAGDRNGEIAPRHAVDHDQQRIDSGRRMKCACQVHRRDGKPDRIRRNPEAWLASLTITSPTSADTR